MKHLILVFASIATFGGHTALAEPIKVLEANDLAWETTLEGVAFAALQGNRFEEAYQAMVSLPAGTISPPHMKSANMYGVVVQGEMIHYAKDKDPADASHVGPGGFYHIPAGLAHISACVSDDPCIAYLYQDGAFDFVVAQ